MVKGKHKNSRQGKMILEFMQKNRDIATGLNKRERSTIDAEWCNLAKHLNAQGPPSKNVSEWKKVWTDWKKNIRKKLFHNEAERRKNCGGPGYTMSISETDDTIAVLTNMYTEVSGIKNTHTFGNEIELTENSFDENPNATNEVFENIILSEDENVAEKPIELLKKTTNRRNINVTRYMDSHTKILLDICKEMKNLSEIAKENKNSFERTFTSIEKLCDTLRDQNIILKEETEAKKRHYTEMEKIAKEKVEIKRKILDIEQLKLKIGF